MPPPPHSALTRALSALFALLQCLTAGGIFTFPLYSPILARTLRLSSSQVNLVASFGILGEYAASPLFGQVADRQGPGAVSAIAALLFAVGFGGFGWRQQVGVARDERGEVPWEGEWVILAIFYFMVGTAACASYFASLISLTKSSPARHSGLAIGLPCAVFGLSPLFLSSLAYFFTSTTSHPSREPGELDAGLYLLFLAFLLALVNGLGSVFVKELPWEENLEKVVVDAFEPETADDVERLLPPAREAGRLSGTASPDERTALLRRESVSLAAGGNDEKSRALGALVSTASFWLLGAVLFFSTGPAETYMASVGAILGSLVSPNTIPSTLKASANLLVLRKEHVSLLSISNTFARLAIGMLSDWLSAPGKAGSPVVEGWRRNVRLWFIGGVSVLLTLAYTWGAVGLTSPSGLWIITLVTGLTYGTVFTLMPALARTRWGVSDFGRNWGLLTWFSAAGALVLTPVFGILRDLAASADPSTDADTCYGPTCYRPFFAFSTASGLLAVGATAVVMRRWRGRR